MSATQVKRPFRFVRPTRDESDIEIEITPGFVSVAGSGPMDWHQAELLSKSIQNAAVAARFYADLREQSADIGSRCTRCGDEIREGVVSVEDPDHPGRRRHAEGSPACART